MRELEASLQQFGEFLLKARLVNEKAAPYCVGTQIPDAPCVGRALGGPGTQILRGARARRSLGRLAGPSSRTALRIYERRLR